MTNSLAEEVMPSNLKYAALIPLLKKAGMDEEDMSSYTPIYNFTFCRNL